MFLEKLLVEKEHSRINGMYLYSNGVPMVDVSAILILTQAKYQEHLHNSYEKRLEFERKKSIKLQQEMDRKTEERRRIN